MNKKKEQANCADHANLLVAMFRTVGIPIYYESWLVIKNDYNTGHLIARAYVNGQWFRLDATDKYAKWGKPSWNLGGGEFRDSYILYTKTYVAIKNGLSDADYGDSFSKLKLYGDLI